jgi:hypothetical protein
MSDHTFLGLLNAWTIMFPRFAFMYVNRRIGAVMEIFEE